MALQYLLKEYMLVTFYKRGYSTNMGKGGKGGKGMCMLVHHVPFIIVLST